MEYFVGVDVGTGSARAGIFNFKGELLSTARQDITIYREGTDIVEQSSDNIWQAICESIKSALSSAKVSADQIKGIGFDATCSLVVLDKHEQPLTVSSSGDNSRNIIVWMDQRATDQAIRINQTGHQVLKYVGGKISPEMQTPKLLWLKENMPAVYSKVGHLFDLTDYLTWRATGDLSRSRCTVTCKWTYMSHENNWDASYFHEIGLSDLTENDFSIIGSNVLDAGTALGVGLTVAAAVDLGLVAGTPVAVGLIDAHAGGIGTVGAFSPNLSLKNRMAYIFGTSACTMSSSTQQAFVPGVWGPYYSAMVPGLWLSEGGQSAAGEAISHLLKLHPFYEKAKNEANESNYSLPNYLLNLIEKKGIPTSEIIYLAKKIIVVPEFLGNRAPFSDPNTRAIISGLDLDLSINGLIALYIAGIVGLGYGLKQIIKVQVENGVCTDTVVISGGAGQSSIIKQLLADSAGITIVGSNTQEPVLLGSAMLGAVASGAYSSLTSAMKEMSSLGDVFEPIRGVISQHHVNCFKIFEALQSAAKIEPILNQVKNEV
ncbi:FGGY-family carbohydrate kinase [Marinomonas flavescens]|uniref:FGGY-family carbohydrate kinase n=1 Tax=Marinomonas flavescens TaxID=2529379 RepID=UPI0010547478|nr:FGGY-family carbohydrate kinase [Marinomonas flavescens]